MHGDLKSMRRVRLLFDHLAVGLGDFLREGEKHAARSKPVSSPHDSE